MDDLEREVVEIEDSFKRVVSELNRELDYEAGESAGSLLREFDEYSDLDAIREQINYLVELILSELATLKIQLGGGSGQEVQGRILALQGLLARLTDLADQVDRKIRLLTARQTQNNASFAQIGQWAKDKLKIIKNWLKSICSRLWQLLSRLLTPKEWKLSGKAGTPIFNLAEVGVEITFG